jgi:hypothetical protein
METSTKVAAYPQAVKEVRIGKKMIKEVLLKSGELFRRNAAWGVYNSKRRTSRTSTGKQAG